jgi:hypothetical protein
MRAARDVQAVILGVHGDVVEAPFSATQIGSKRAFLSNSKTASLDPERKQTFAVHAFISVHAQLNLIFMSMGGLQAHGWGTQNRLGSAGVKLSRLKLDKFPKLTLIDAGCPTQASRQRQRSILTFSISEKRKATKNSNRVEMNKKGN